MLPIEKAEYLDRLGLSERDFTEQLNAPALACYLPPIVERHGKNKVIMDGIHRNYIAKQYGVSINAILVEEISIPFPCGMREWDELQAISLDKKPADINERYFDLTKELFRDLKYLGIDG